MQGLSAAGDPEVDSAMCARGGSLGRRNIVDHGCVVTVELPRHG
jgi:hypothetical protein